MKQSQFFGLAALVMLAPHCSALYGIGIGAVYLIFAFRHAWKEQQ
jgi:hypothetical protein